MLQAIRDRAQTWLAWVIVGFISIPFALWGIQEYLGTGGPQLAAEVEGLEIDVDDYRQTVERYRQSQRQRLAQIFGDDLNNPLVKNLLDDKVIKKQALDGMIESRLISLAATRAGFNIDEEQINALIRGVPAFQQNGQFDNETYQRQLRSQGMSSKGFKARVSQEQIANQMMNGLAITSFATPYEVDEQLRMKFQQREAGYLTLKASVFEHQVKIDDDKIKSYYETNIDRFKTQEKVSLEYLELSAATLAATIKVDEASLREYYEQHTDRYLVTDDREQRALLADIKARLEKGEDFAALAKQYSNDPGSADAGGELGMIGRGIMDKPFEDAMFALEAGEVSDVVETSFGLHLIKVDEINGEERAVRHILVELDKQKLRSRSFEEVHGKVEKDYLTEKTDKAFNDKYDMLNNLSYEHPDTLSIAAEETGLPLQTSEQFTRAGGKGIAAIPAIVNAAFSENVLIQGQNSELLDLGEERVVVLRIRKHIPAAPRPLDEVNDLIIKSLLKETGAELAKQVGEKVLAELKEGGNPQALAVENKSEWKAASFYSRDSKGIHSVVLKTIFAMPRPEEDRPAFTGVALPSGDYVVAGLYSVKEADATSSQTAERLAASKSVAARDSSSAVKMLTRDLRDKASITIFDKNL